MLAENNLSKYLLYAIGEIILVVIGILIALQINNLNETRKESNLEDQLIDVLITDLGFKKAEFLSDLAIGNSIILKSDITISNWKTNNEIDTLYLKTLLKILAEDDWFFNENSPIHATISGSGLWKQLPDSLTTQIDKIYRSRFGSIKSSFVKQSEYALNAKSSFLAPNHLLDLNDNILEIQQIVSKNNEEFISHLELFKSGVIRLTSKFKTTIPAIDKLIEDLQYYKESK